MEKPNNKQNPADADDQRSGLDEPLKDPSGDLLDMNDHALALAKYIRAQEKELPFTVGIFGEWGEGKTTMVRFLEYHLTKLKTEETKTPATEEAKTPATEETKAPATEEAKAPATEETKAPATEEA